MISGTHIIKATGPNHVVGYNNSLDMAPIEHLFLLMEERLQWYDLYKRVFIKMKNPIEAPFHIDDVDEVLKVMVHEMFVIDKEIKKRGFDPRVLAKQFAIGDDPEDKRLQS